MGRPDRARSHRTEIQFAPLRGSKQCGSPHGSISSQRGKLPHRRLAHWGARRPTSGRLGERGLGIRQVGHEELDEQGASGHRGRQRPTVRGSDECFELHVHDIGYALKDLECDDKSAEDVTLQVLGGIPAAKPMNDACYGLETHALGAAETGENEEPNSCSPTQPDIPYDMVPP